MALYSKEELYVISKNNELLYQEIDRTKGLILQELKENNMLSLSELVDILFEKTKNAPEKLVKEIGLSTILSTNVLFLYNYKDEDFYNLNKKQKAFCSFCFASDNRNTTNSLENKLANDYLHNIKIFSSSKLFQMRNVVENEQLPLVAKEITQHMTEPHSKIMGMHEALTNKLIHMAALDDFVTDGDNYSKTIINNNLMHLNISTYLLEDTSEKYIINACKNLKDIEVTPVHLNNIKINGNLKEKEILEKYPEVAKSYAQANVFTGLIKQSLRWVNDLDLDLFSEDEEEVKKLSDKWKNITNLMIDTAIQIDKENLNNQKEYGLNLLSYVLFKHGIFSEKLKSFLYSINGSYPLIEYKFNSFKQLERNYYNSEKEYLHAGFDFSKNPETLNLNVNEQLLEIIKEKISIMGKFEYEGSRSQNRQLVTFIDNIDFTNYIREKENNLENLSLLRSFNHLTLNQSLQGEIFTSNNTLGEVIKMLGGVDKTIEYIDVNHKKNVMINLAYKMVQPTVITYNKKESTLILEIANLHNNLEHLNNEFKKHKNGSLIEKEILFEAVNLCFNQISNINEGLQSNKFPLSQKLMDEFDSTKYKELFDFYAAMYKEQMLNNPENFNFFYKSVETEIENVQNFFNSINLDVKVLFKQQDLIDLLKKDKKYQIYFLMGNTKNGLKKSFFSLKENENNIDFMNDMLDNIFLSNNVKKDEKLAILYLLMDDYEINAKVDNQGFNYLKLAIKLTEEINLKNPNLNLNLSNVKDFINKVDKKAQNFVDVILEHDGDIGTTEDEIKKIYISMLEESFQKNYNNIITKTVGDIPEEVFFEAAAIDTISYLCNTTGKGDFRFFIKNEQDILNKLMGYDYVSALNEQCKDFMKVFENLWNKSISEKNSSVINWLVSVLGDDSYLSKNELERLFVEQDNGYKELLKIGAIENYYSTKSKVAFVVNNYFYAFDYKQYANNMLNKSYNHIKKACVESINDMNENISFNALMKYMIYTSEIFYSVSERNIENKLLTDSDVPVLKTEALIKLLKQSSNEEKAMIKEFFYRKTVKFEDDALEKIIEYGLENLIIDKQNDFEIRGILNTDGKLTYGFNNELFANILFAIEKNKSIQKNNKVAKEQDLAISLLVKAKNFRKTTKYPQLINIIIEESRQNPKLFVKHLGIEEYLAIIQRGLYKNDSAVLRITTDLTYSESFLEKVFTKPKQYIYEIPDFFYHYKFKKIDSKAIKYLVNNKKFGKLLNDFVSLLKTSELSDNFKRQIKNDLFVQSINLEIDILKKNYNPFSQSVFIKDNQNNSPQKLFSRTEEILEEFNSELLIEFKKLKEEIIKDAFFKAASGSAITNIIEIDDTSIQQAFYQYGNELNNIIRNNITEISFTKNETGIYENIKYDSFNTTRYVSENDLIWKNDFSDLEINYKDLYKMKELERKRVIAAMNSGYVGIYDYYTSSVLNKNEEIFIKNIREVDLKMQLNSIEKDTNVRIKKKI